MLDIIIYAYLYLFYLFFFRWLPELNGLITDLRDKLANKQKLRKSKPATGTQQRQNGSFYYYLETQVQRCRIISCFA